MVIYKIKGYVLRDKKLEPYEFLYTDSPDPIRTAISVGVVEGVIQSLEYPDKEFKLVALIDSKGNIRKVSSK